jgi:hypothetical protein
MMNTVLLSQLGQLASAQSADINYGDGQYSGLKQEKLELPSQEIDYSVPITAEGVDIEWLVNVGRAWEQEEYPSSYLFVENTRWEQPNPFSVITA